MGEKYEWKGAFGRFLNGFRHLPVFWKHLLMMVCIVLMAVCALSLSNRISLSSLRERTLKEMQMEFDHSCDSFSQSIYEASSIPSGVENGRYFNYIGTLMTDTVPREYVPVVSYVGDSLRKYMLLQSTVRECILYIPSCNSICTNRKNFPKAESCFEYYMSFEEMDGDQVIGEIMAEFGIRILPSQKVTVSEIGELDVVPIVIRPATSRLGLMLLYSEDEFLRSLKMHVMPEGTCLDVYGEDGSLLLSYCAGEDHSAREKGYEIVSSMSHLHTETRLYIPEEYFEDVLEPARTAGYVMIAITVLLGLGLCVLLSNMTVMPVRSILKRSGVDPSEYLGRNELLYLNSILENSRQDLSELQYSLSVSHLARALSGAVLQEQEVEQIKMMLGTVPEAYRVAVLRSDNEINAKLATGIITEYFPGHFFFQPVNAVESAMFFEENAENMKLFYDGIEKLRRELAGGEGKIMCGISSRGKDLKDIHLAVRQAHIALQSGAETAEYHGGGYHMSSISWSRLEGLYQKIIANDAEGALMVLRPMINDPGARHEAFYSIRHMLRTAADEIGLPYEAEEIAHYDNNVLAKDNLAKLEKMLLSMFHKIRDRQGRKEQAWEQKVLQWVQEHFCDYTICAASCAEVFGITENRAYALIRKMTGKSLNDYVTGLRMKHAAKLLLTTRDDIQSVAERCGYQVMNTFYRVFKKHYGVTPAEYRKTGGQTNL